MVVLVKCNAASLPREGDELSIMLGTHPKDLRVPAGEEVFVWTSENPRGPRGRGLERRGALLQPSRPSSGGRMELVIHLAERLAGSSFGMAALERLGETSDAARDLQGRIAPFRHQRIWLISPPPP